MVDLGPQQFHNWQSSRVLQLLHHQKVFPDWFPNVAYLASVGLCRVGLWRAALGWLGCEGQGCALLGWVGWGWAVLWRAALGWLGCEGQGCALLGWVGWGWAVQVCSAGAGMEGSKTLAIRWKEGGQVWGGGKVLTEVKREPLL